MNTDKVFEISFSFTETAHGLVIGESLEHVNAGLQEKYGHFPDFKIVKVKELEEPVEDDDESTPPESPITLN